MAKRLIKDSLFLQRYKDVEIVYPFCYKTRNEKNFFRYLEDGRYEYICIEERKVHMSFGTRVDSIQGLMNDDDFYFKILANQDTIITNEEFESKRNEYYEKYKQYLSGNEYLARELVSVIQMKKPTQEQEKSFTSNDIIINNEYGKEEPF